MTMKRLRSISGASALILLAIALNVVVMAQTPFALRVIIPFGLAFLFFVVWLTLSATSWTDTLRRQKTLAGINSVTSSLVFLTICVTSYALIKLWDREWDLTKEGRRQLAEQTVQVLENLDKDTYITCFFLSGPTADELTNVALDKTRRFLEQCAKYSSRLNVEFVDPQAHPERLQALNVKRISGTGIIVMKCGARVREIAISDVTGRLEERDFTNSLINVIRDSNPKVYFIMGHGERSILDDSEVGGGSDFGRWLNHDGYQGSPLLFGTESPIVPADCSLLVINGYTTDYRIDEIRALDDYILQGGRLLILVEPSFLVDDVGLGAERLRPWIERRLGIVLGQDLVITMLNGEPSPRVFLNPGVYNRDFDPETNFNGSFNQAHPITRGHDKQMLIPTVRTVRAAPNPPKNVAGMAILRTMTTSYAETDLRRLKEQGQAFQDADEEQGYLPIAMAVTLHNDTLLPGGRPPRDARAVVIGDTDMTANEYIGYEGHYNLLLNAVAWLTENEELIAIRPTGEEDPPLILSETEERVIAWVASLGVLQTVIIAGLVVYYVRRKVQ